MISDQVNAESYGRREAIIFLLIVLMERLESAGVLNELRARIRAELLSAMEGKVRFIT